MTKQQIITLLTKYATVPNQAGTKKFIPSDKINEIAGEIMKLQKGSFVPPSLDEVKEFVKSKGYTEECAIKAWEYYDAMDWHDRDDKPVKRWKGKIISNWLRPEYKIVEKSKTEGMVY